MKLSKYIKNWRIEWDFNNFVEDENNKVKKHRVFYESDEIDSSCSENKKLFDKIAFLKLTNTSKNNIAEEIVKHSYPTKLYWIQLTLSCIIAALWLFMNSIPVIIWAMLISPLLDPIKTFAFAITNWHKSMYIRSIKTILLSILVAILSSVFVAFIVPFSQITSEIVARISPNMLDLFVAFFSWIVAFLSLWFKRLQESIAWVAIAVALLPPLSIVGIWIFFLDFSVAQGSFLLFFTNLVAILVVWIIFFYMFWFFPTNKKWQKRSLIILLMVIFSVLLISIPLKKSMTQIAENMTITNQINNISKSYLDSINKKISLDKIFFNNLSDDVLRVSAVLNVPSDVLVTKDNKDELTKLLSLEIEKSVELDLSIVEISSVYIWKQETKEDKLLLNINNILSDEFCDVFVLDYRIVDKAETLLFLNLYADKDINKESIYDLILLQLKEIYWDTSNLIIEWKNNDFAKKDKTQQELELEKQFYFLFSWSKLDRLTINTQIEMLSGEQYQYILLDVDFQTPDTVIEIKDRLLDWKMVLEQYFAIDIKIKSNIKYFSLLEL